MTIYALADKKPQLPPDGEYWVAPNAILTGDVILKPGASVWFGAVVRGDNDPITIGRDTNIQDGSVLHSDPGEPLTIGDGVTVGHMVMLHSCEIGDNTLIGIGAVVLGRARIGKNCLIGANTLITEGKVIPDGSLVMGQPGKVVRELEPGQIEALRASAAHYVQNWRRYRRDLAALTPDAGRAPPQD
ncbi:MULTISPECIES: gamma carbonic anhydrase family protein [unclassified Brevundimonas]|uniref:gamma carbonic anhydrase family protein n=1 Tax=unclassified Brevundimonas TaxID=2622653 RepID=UPI0006F4A52D|nr:MULTISPECIES: gamma carbonic anhydrase family protein [unclassified Brevundimonas]KQY70232.1 anhydrase [Brevundimonas sp. Root1423]KRA28942.1 anhydrase [Brevundimonas sp. Root608]